MGVGAACGTGSHMCGMCPSLIDTPILGMVRPGAPKPGIVLAPKRDDESVAGDDGGLEILAQTYLSASHS